MNGVRTARIHETRTAQPSSLTRTTTMISTLLKLVYRHSHTSKWRHNERLWPHARIERDAVGVIERFTWRGRHVPLARRSELQRLRRLPCHIIASGPSIADIDYDALPMHHVMGVNGAIALADRAPVKFNDYCILDAGFVRQRPDLARRIVARDLVLFVTPVVLARLLEMFPMSAFGCRFYLVDDIFKRGMEAARTPEALRADPRVAASAAFVGERGRLGFSFDIDNGFFHGGTVAYFALQVATWLGFTEMYLHGVDLRAASQTPRFYETMQARAPTQLDAEYADLIEPSFRHASEVLRARGVRVENLSYVSALGDDIFKKVDWRSLRRRNLSLVVPDEAVPAPSDQSAGMAAVLAPRPTGTHGHS
ncbi:hypothetical protein PBR20603_00938 [Pandoraea bronchicola]|uniref:Lipopolysaccharide core biosynthesis protein n=2 Tax=Pandoraea bronchicola TaxID=2508287 RepID=A0A5E5BRA6_9BURK|nr:hypothetical protein PBR20603_00938 [Pandoraea bronchicola]